MSDKSLETSSEMSLKVSLEGLQQGAHLSVQQLYTLTHTLNAALKGARLQKLRDPERHSLSLKLRSPGQTYYLTLSADPEGAWLRLGREQPPTLPSPTGVGRWARAHLEGTKLSAVRLLEGDRVVALEFLGPPATDEHPQRGGALYLELIPTLQCLYALDLQGKVRSWTGRVASRGLHLGRAWTAPEQREGFEPASLAPLPTLSVEEARALLDPLMSAEQARAEASGEDKASREARERAQLFKKTRARLKRLVTALWGDIERADEAELWGQRAELLKSELGRLKRGMTSVRVTNWFDPELAELEIPLDPTRDGKENMERLFQKQRKAVRGAEIATERLEHAEEQLAAVEALAVELAEAPLDEVRAALRQLGALRERPQQGKRGEVEKRKPYRVFWSAQGEELWVGRGGADNHATSFQCARGQDLWVHTRDVPGAHVIIPLPRRGYEPHIETLRDAAALAVHNSPQRGEEGAPLYLTERKHIRPVPGGPAGKVMVAASKTLIATELEERVERLYAEARRRGSI